MRALISHVLQAEAIDVVEVATAEELLEQWRALGPDVIVLDERMPPSSGLDVAEEILAHQPGQLIFLFTAFVDAKIRAQAERVGITACVSKDQVFEIPALVRARVTPE